jgi:hypothetical protein
MSKSNKIIIVIAVIIIGFIIGYNNNHYSMVGYVTSSDEQSVVICDEVGMLWELEPNDKYKAGDDVYVRWFDHSTLKRNDDEIVHVKILK